MNSNVLFIFNAAARAANIFDYFECWVPNENKSKLVFAGAETLAVDDKKKLDEFKKLSEKFMWEKSVGTPGRVWKLGSIEWQVDCSKLPVTMFLRNTYTAEAGLRALCAVPLVFKATGDSVAIGVFFMKRAFEYNSRLVDLIQGVCSQMFENSSILPPIAAASLAVQITNTKTKLKQQDPRSLEICKRILGTPAIIRTANEVQFLYEFVDGMCFFEQFGEKQRWELCRQLSLRHCEKGDVVYREGDAADKSYFILSGSVDVTVNMHPNHPETAPVHIKSASASMTPSPSNPESPSSISSPLTLFTNIGDSPTHGHGHHGSHMESSSSAEVIHSDQSSMVQPESHVSLQQDPTGNSELSDIVAAPSSPSHAREKEVREQIEDMIRTFTLKGGEQFGKAALAEDRPRDETIVAASAVDLMVIDKQEYLRSITVPLKDLTFNELAQYFHLSMAEAAKLLGVCITVLKKVCRDRGIIRWPYRKVRSLNRSISDLEESLDAEAVSDQKVDRIRLELLQLKLERLQLTKESRLLNFAPSDLLFTSGLNLGAHAASNYINPQAQNKDAKQLPSVYGPPGYFANVARLDYDNKPKTEMYSSSSSSNSYRPAMHLSASMHNEAAHHQSTEHLADLDRLVRQHATPSRLMTHGSIPSTPVVPATPGQPNSMDISPAALLQHQQTIVANPVLAALFGGQSIVSQLMELQNIQTYNSSPNSAARQFSSQVEQISNYIAMLKNNATMAAANAGGMNQHMNTPLPPNANNISTMLNQAMNQTPNTFNQSSNAPNSHMNHMGMQNQMNFPVQNFQQQQQQHQPQFNMQMPMDYNQQQYSQQQQQQQQHHQQPQQQQHQQQQHQQQQHQQQQLSQHNADINLNGGPEAKRRRVDDNGLHSFFSNASFNGYPSSPELQIGSPQVVPVTSCPNTSSMPMHSNMMDTMAADLVMPRARRYE